MDFEVMERIAELEDKIMRQEGRINLLKKQLHQASENNHKRNLQLDALHFVWCSGGCENGIHRWTKEELTEEIVQEAVRNTERLVTYYRNVQFKKWWKGLNFDQKEYLDRLQERLFKMRCAIIELKKAGERVVTALRCARNSHHPFEYEDIIEAMVKAMNVNDRTGEKEDGRETGETERSNPGNDLKNEGCDI